MKRLVSEAEYQRMLNAIKATHFLMQHYSDKDCACHDMLPELAKQLQHLACDIRSVAIDEDY